MKFFAPLLALAATTAAQLQLIGLPFKSPVTVASGFAAKVIFSNLTSPRGIAFDAQQNLLVVERGLGVSAFTSVQTGAINTGWHRTLVLKNPGLTHGIQVDGSRLFVSTADSVLVYAYDAATKTVGIVMPPYPIINGLPADGELLTHTLQLERSGSGAVVAILVGSGPLTNIDATARDPESGRSQIRRFALPAFSSSSQPIPAPIPWGKGQIIAYGIRNPAGFAFPTGPSITPVGSRDLYIVENGASIGEVGLTPKFVNDNPADELEFVNYPTGQIVAAKPTFFGFPDCTTLWNGAADPVGEPQFVGRPRGDQFSLNLIRIRDDTWCKNSSNNKPPSLSFQAHSVPLDIKFYTPPSILSRTSFPATLKDDAFVSFRGSFDRSPPTGYGVVHVPFPLGASVSKLDYRFIVQAKDLNSCPGTCIRPVGLAFSVDGRLFVSSDSSGELFVIEQSQYIISES